MKNCNNCYWQGYKNQWCIYEYKEPVKKVCEKHNFICEDCEGEQAEYTHEGKKYCCSCLLKKFKVEESTTTHYYLNGEYLGSDEGFEEVVENLDDGIELLE